MERDIEAQIESVIKARLSNSSRRSYDSANSRFFDWLKQVEPSKVHNGKILVNKLTSSVIRSFLVTLLYRKKDNGDEDGVGYAGLKMHRSALNHLYRESGHNGIPEDIARDLSLFYCGLKRVDAKKRRDGTKRLSEGKEALPFSLYAWMAKKMICSKKEQLRWAHCYAILSWNLMCRCNNTAFISYDRMSWDNDALCIFFAVTKTDQGGERPKFPIHIYANPFKPEICPVLALALYCCYFSGDIKGNMLFPGESQERRFGMQLSKLLLSSRDFLSLYGFNPHDLGTHSFRKGATTFTTSGSAQGPSFNGVCQRAGWKLGTVQDKYLKYERASDQYVGRVVSGLPLDKPEFSVLPPHFALNDEKEIHFALQECFGKKLCSFTRMVPVLRMCLASLVYHNEWIKTEIPETSSVFQTRFFSNTDLTTKLKKHLGSLYHSDTINATGIPCHISQLKELHDLGERVDCFGKNLKNHSENMVNTILHGMNDILERKSYEQGNLTPTSIQEHVKKTISESIQVNLEIAGVFDVIRSLRDVGDQPSTSETIGSDSVESAISGGSAPLYNWDGCFRRVPETFSLPKVNLKAGWNLWWLGNSRTNIPPIRLLSKFDIKKALKKEFNEWKTVFGKLEIYLKRRGEIKRNITAVEVSEMFIVVEEILLDKLGNNRRILQLHVSTVAKKMRKLSI